MDFEWVGEFISDYGINGVAAFALLIMSWAQMLDRRVKLAVVATSQDSTNTKLKTQLAEAQTELLDAKTQSKVAEQMVNIAESTSGLSVGVAGIVHAINEMAITNDRKLGTIEMTATTIQGETKKTTEIVGGIMDKLNETEASPTMAEQLNELIREVREVKQVMRQLSEDFTGTIVDVTKDFTGKITDVTEDFTTRHQEIESKFDGVQETVASLVEQSKRDTQELKAVGIDPSPDNQPIVPATPTHSKPKPEEKDENDV